MVGIAAGYLTTVAIKNIQDMAYVKVLAGNYLYVIPLILGVLIFTRLTINYGRISTWPIAWVMGIGTAAAIYGVIKSQIFDQISLPLTFFTVNLVNNAIIVILTICTLFYFYFTVDMKGPLKPIYTVGRFTLMITFGATFAGTVLSRVAYFLGTAKVIIKVPEFSLLFGLVILVYFIYVDVLRRKH
jgi:hypothetical protein